MRNVTALGLVSFFTDFSTEMVLGVLPLFIISSLGASRAFLEQLKAHLILQVMYLGWFLVLYMIR
jgi:hypothetical protein